MSANSVMQEAARFVALLMHARTAAHMMHLQTRSYAQHMALGAFYEGIGSLLDDYAEAFQGLYGIITPYPQGFTPPGGDAVAEIKRVAQSVRECRKELPQDTELQNIIDEIAGLLDSTLYKLRFLA